MQWNVPCHNEWDFLLFIFFAVIQIQVSKRTTYRHRIPTIILFVFHLARSFHKLIKWRVTVTLFCHLFHETFVNWRDTWQTNIFKFRFRAQMTSKIMTSMMSSVFPVGAAFWDFFREGFFSALSFGGVFARFSLRHLLVTAYEWYQFNPRPPSRQTLDRVPVPIDRFSTPCKV